MGLRRWILAGVLFAAAVLVAVDDGEAFDFADLADGTMLHHEHLVVLLVLGAIMFALLPTS